MNSQQISRKIDLYIIGFAIVFFAFSLFLVKTRPEGVFWSLDEGGKFIYLQSVLLEGKINTPLVYPGENLDPDFNFIPLYFFVKQGQEVFSWWAYGFPLTTLPFYLSLGWLGLYVLPAFCGALILWLTGKIAGLLVGADSWWRWWVAFATGVSTPVWFYSTMFWEHTLATACVLAAIYLLLSCPLPGRGLDVAVSGLLAALAVFYRPESVAILGGVGLALLLFREYRKAIIYGCAFVIGMIPFSLFNIYTTGGFITPNYGGVQSLDLFTGIQQVGWRFFPRILFNMNRADTFGLSTKVLLIASVLFILAGCFSFFRNRGLWATFFSIFGLLGICAYVLFQPDQYIALHGFITAAPIVLLALLINSTFGQWDRPIFPWMIILSSFGFISMYVLKAWGEAGGLQWGPRYMLSLYPLYILAAVYGMRQRMAYIAPKWEKMEKAAIYLLLGLSFCIGLGFEIRGLVTARDRMLIYKQTADSIMALPEEEPRVTQCAIFAMNIPELYFSGNLFLERPNQVLWKDRSGGTYQEIQIIPCNNDPINKVRQELKNHPSGIISILKGGS